jgi:hypothetical protein
MRDMENNTPAEKQAQGIYREITLNQTPWVYLACIV